MATTKIVQTNEKTTRLHEAFKKSIIHASTDGVPIDQVLAVSCKIVGMLIALQDQRLGRDAIMEMVAKNIESGNQDLIDFAFGSIVGGKQ